MAIHFKDNDVKIEPILNKYFALYFQTPKKTSNKR